MARKINEHQHQHVGCYFTAEKRPVMCFAMPQENCNITKRVIAPAIALFCDIMLSFFSLICGFSALKYRYRHQAAAEFAFNFNCLIAAKILNYKVKEDIKNRLLVA